MLRAQGPFEVLEKINDNAYKVDFLGDYGVSTTLNVADLSPYHAHDCLADLRIKLSHQGEDNRVPSRQDLNEGPISLARSNSSTKVQAMTHMLLTSQEDGPGFCHQNVLGFVHVISEATLWLKSNIFAFLGSLDVTFHVQASKVNHAKSK